MGSPAWQEQGAPGAAELMDDQGAAEHRENEKTRQYQENKVIFLAAALLPARGWGVPFSATQTHSSNQQVNKRGKYQMEKRNVSVLPDRAQLAAQASPKAHPALERLEGAITQQSGILLFAGLIFSKGVILSKLCQTGQSS